LSCRKIGSTFGFRLCRASLVEQEDADPAD
jgi:hypothetical protein